MKASTNSSVSYGSLLRKWIVACAAAAVIGLLGAARGAEVDLTPVSTSGGTYAQVTVAGESVWQNTGGSGYLYARRPNTFSFTVGQTLYVRATYYDDSGGSRIALTYDEQTNAYKAPATSTRTLRVGSGQFVDAHFELKNVNFQNRQNGSTDFRLVCGAPGGVSMSVRRITLSDTPFDNLDFQLAISRAWQTRYTGPAKDYVDTTTLKGKVMAGYQGWFNSPNDLEDGGWVHWVRNNTMTPENFTVDMWPDLTEYDPASLFRAGNVTTSSGQPAYVFSPASYSAVQKHFRWMRKHNIDGAFVQRFNPKAGASAEWVLRNVSQAAAEEGRIWAVEYDVSGMADATVAAKLQADWEWLTTQFDILNDPRYAREGGKPVVFIWGLPVPDRNFTPASANAVVDYFKAQGTYVIGGLPNVWSTLSAAWQTHIAKYDGVLVWQNGSTSDASLFRNRGQDFYPHIWPGFSWANLQQQPATTSYTNRNGGQFYWDKGRDWINSGAADRLFIGMFDEYDEGTAIMPMTDDPPDPSAAYGRFLNNQGKPSDWWMMLSDELKRMMFAQRTNTGTLPTVASLTNRSNIGAEASVDLGTTDVTSSLSRVQQADGNTTVETVGGRECRGNTALATDRYLYFNVANTFAYQLVNGDVTIEVEYYDSFYGTAGGTTLGLQYDGAGATYTTHSQSITTTGSNTWRTVRFEIADAYFGGRQNGGSDFRLTFGGKKLNVNRVWVRLPEGKAYPFTWTNATAGPALTWSQNANWLGGIVAQSDPTSIVRLFPGQTMPGGAIPVSNNVTGQQFGTLQLGGTAASSADTTVTLSGNAFSLGGTAPAITLDAMKTAFDLIYDIAAPVTLLDTTQVGGAGNTTLRISGALDGTGGLTKTTPGTLVLSGANTYTGATAVNSGTLALGANNALPSTALTLGSARLDAASFTDTVGPLAVTGSAVINLGTGASLAFADSSAMNWSGGTLTLAGTFVSGSSLRFGTGNGSLTPAQLSQISAPGFAGFTLNSSGYLTAVGGITYTITNTTTDVNGTCAPTGVTSVAGGGSQTYTITPNADYAVATLTVNGSPVPPAPSYTFTNLSANQTIAATFVNIATATLYWDSDNTTPGFGSTPGTWGTSQFWSLDAGGSSAPIPITTTSNSSVNFGSPTLDYSSANVTVAAGGVSAGNLTFGAGQSTPLTLSGGNITLGTTAVITVNNAANTIASVLAGAGTSLTKAGTGSLTLSAANTYSGNTAIAAGTLQFANAAAMPASGTVALGNGATLAVNIGGVGEWTTGTTGAGTLGGLLAGIGGQGAPVTYTGNTTIGFDTTNASGNQTYAGVIANLGTALGLGKLGAGTLTLTANNTFGGGTTISAGTLALSGGNNTLADAGAVNLSGSGSTFNISGVTTGETIGSLSGVTGSSVALGGKTLTVGDAGNTIFAGNITSAGILTKQGAGTLSLSGANAYSTTTVNAGTLELSGGGIFTSNKIWSGTGTLNVTGGTFTGQNQAFNAATMNQTGGTVTIAGSSSSGSWIGYQGTARNINYTISGGDFNLNGTSAAYLSIGRNWAANTIFTVKTGGTVNIGTAGDGNLYINGNTGDTNTAKLDVQGGDLTIGAFNAANILAFFPAAATTTAKSAIMTQSGGNVTANGIRFGGDTGTFTAANATLTLSSGNLYVGALGIFRGGNATALLPAIQLQGGTLGASATWSSSLGMRLGNTTGGPTIQAGNSTGTAYDITLSGVLSNDGAAVGTLTKTGTGTLTLSGNNTYTGATTINGGTLALGANNALPSTALTLGNATLNAATFTDTVGPLAVTGRATINLGTGASLSFANSSAIAWTGGTLTLTGTFVSGSSLRFGTTSGGLTPAQLNQISAPGVSGFILNSSGFLTAAPPGFSSWITGTFGGGQLPTNQRGPTDDPDNDGIANLLEYALAGQDPTVPGPTVSSFDNNILSFTKRANTNGLTYLIEVSTDLGITDPWAEATGLGYTNNTISISYTFTAGTPPRLFARLKVTQAP